LAEAAFAIAAPSAGAAKPEPIDAALATNAVTASSEYVNLRIALS
jgi:hypothetical protein